MVYSSRINLRLLVKEEQVLDEHQAPLEKGYKIGQPANY
jgi:hypothetical protein